MIDKFAGFYIDEISGEHKRIISKLTSVFKKKEWVKGILLEGSYADENIEKDIFSDVDICIVIKKNKKEFVEGAIKALIKEFTEPHFFHQTQGAGLCYSIWVLPFIRVDLSFCEINEISPKLKLNKHVKILFDINNQLKNHFKNKKTLLSRIKLERLLELDAMFWMMVFFIYTKIEKNNFCAVYDGFHFIVVKILLKLRKLDYTSPPSLQIHNLMKKDPFLYKEMEIILDFPNEPIDSLLRSIILYKSLLKRILKQEGLKFDPKAEEVVLRIIQRGLITRTKRWI
ncbi:MAG: aminoglycoside 6-adenylyltransferase [bacterium]|nr:aminoglycoside 6-adenylyltransferase [bacterium]